MGINTANELDAFMAYASEVQMPEAEHERGYVIWLASKRHAAQVAEPTLEQEHEEGVALFLASATVAPVDVLWAEPVAEPAPSGASVDSVARDAARLMFAMQDIDGFGALKLDKHDYAMQCMEEAGRDEPTADDELNGVRRLIDAAMSPTKAGEGDGT